MCVNRLIIRVTAAVIAAVSILAASVAAGEEEQLESARQASAVQEGGVATKESLLAQEAAEEKREAETEALNAQALADASAQKLASALEALSQAQLAAENASRSAVAAAEHAGKAVAAIAQTALEAEEASKTVVLILKEKENDDELLRAATKIVEMSEVAKNDLLDGSGNAVDMERMNEAESVQKMAIASREEARGKALATARAAELAQKEKIRAGERAFAAVKVAEMAVKAKEEAEAQARTAHEAIELARKNAERAAEDAEVLPAMAQSAASLLADATEREKKARARAEAKESELREENMEREREKLAKAEKRRAREEEKALAVAAKAWFKPEERGWYISAGAIMRNPTITLNASPLTAYTAGELASRGSGQGSTSIYNRESSLDYSDGSLTYDSSWSAPFPVGDGTARYSVGSGASYGSRGGNRTITYHSTRTSYSLDNSGLGLPAQEDDDAVVFPYLALHRTIKDFGKTAGRLGVMLRYANGEWDIDDKSVQSGLIEENLTYSFTYDIDPLPGNEKWAVFDASDYNSYSQAAGWGTSASNPSKQVDVAESKPERITIAGNASVHEVLLAMEWQYRLYSRLDVKVSAGPTLNVMEFELERVSTWENSVTSAASVSDTYFGASAETTLALALDSNGRFFLQGSAGYAWISDVLTARIEGVDVEVDLSSFYAGAGILIRFP